MEKKKVLACDLDEVLGQFVPALIDYYNATETDKQISIRDFHTYIFSEVWGGGEERSTRIVENFLRSTNFREISPIPGALEALRILSQEYDLKVVTSRQHYIENDTREWLSRHFPNIFSEVLFGNHWGVTGAKRSKRDMCLEIGATVMIDDNPRYAFDCAQDPSMKVFLFNFHNLYGWSKVDISLTPNIVSVESWHDILVHLAPDKAHMFPKGLFHAFSAPPGTLPHPNPDPIAEPLRREFSDSIAELNTTPSCQS